MRITLTFILAALITAVISSCNGTKKTVGQKPTVKENSTKQPATAAQPETVSEKIIKIATAKARNKNVPVTHASTFNQLGFDELDTVEFIMELEKVFNITIPDGNAKTITTVGQAVAFVQTHQAR